MKKNLYLFRHGESEANKNEKVLGLDSPLTSLGIEQAKNIPQYLQDKNLEIMYSSHLQRAWKTGEIVAKTLKIDIVKCEQLREAFFGDYEGRKKMDALKEFGDDFIKKYESIDPIHNNMGFPNGETKIKVRQRAIKTVSKLAIDSPFETIAFSTHGVFLFQLFVSCLTPDVEIKGFKNCEILHLEFETEKYKVDNPYEAFRFVERIRTDK